MQELLKRVIDGDESAKELLAQKMKAKSDKEKVIILINLDPRRRRIHPN